MPNTNKTLQETQVPLLISDSGTPVLDGPTEVDYGTNLLVTDNLDGTVTIDVIGVTVFEDDVFRVPDNVDNTKKLAFECSGITAATTRTMTVPDSDGTLVQEDNTATFTNKTFDANGTGNVISNIDVADLANGTDGELITWSAAGVATTVAVGTATEVLTSNGVGAAPTFQAPAGGGIQDFAFRNATSTQALSASVYTTVLFGTDVDSNNITHSSGTFTVTDAGTYLTIVRILIRNQSVVIAPLIRINYEGVVTSDWISQKNAAGEHISVGISDAKVLSASDTIAIEVQPGNSNTADLSAFNTNIQILKIA